MPGRNDALTAARFELTIDGHSLGRFETLFAAIAPGAAQRAFQVHELPSLWQHAGEYRAGKFAQTDYGFERPSRGTRPGLHPPRTIVLKRGTVRRTLLERWQKAGGSVTLVALGAAGIPVARYHLNRARVVKFTAPPLSGKGGSDIAMEEIVIGHEGVCLAHHPGCSAMVSKP